jgi:hypothetical protein
MAGMCRYRLKDLSLNRVFGEVCFNGKFTFTLADGIEPATWQAVGIIPLPENRRSIEVTEDQFYYLNSRLPQNLRNGAIEKKLSYVDATGLRVVSDNFVLEKIDDKK